MSNFYQELLESFDLLKKRKFKIEEGKNSIEAETRAKHYIQLAISNASAEHYIVSIPELGSNAKIYLAKNGKQSGKVVIDNVLSMYPLAIADGSGNPLRVPAYYQFVGKFNKILGDDAVPPPPNPMDQMGGGMMGMMPNPTTEGLYKASNRIVSMAINKKLFSLPRSMTSPEWMNPGPDGGYMQLQNLIVGPLPFSLESKINNATKIVNEPLFNMEITVPVSDSDKKLVCDIFHDFSERYNKLYNGTFNEYDASWVNQHIVNDKSGFWIKDPLLLNSGVSLSWRYSNSDPQHGFFRYMILSYNKLYRQWAAEHNTPADKPILDMNKSHLSDLDNYELGSIRGKTAEEVRSVILSLSMGDSETAKAQLEIIANEYGEKVQQAYALVAPYQEGYSAADSSVIGTLNLLQDIERASDKNIQPLMGMMQKLTWLEQYGILKRKPYAVNLLQSTRLGDVSDLEEYYNPGELFNVLTQVHKFSPEEAKDLMKSGSLKIGLKTYLTKKSDVYLSDRNLFELFTSVIDHKTSPFVVNSAREFNIDTGSMVEKTNKLQSITKLVNTLASEIIVPGYPQKSIQKSNLQFMLDKIWSNSEYKDLSIALQLQKLDLSKPEDKKRTKALIESSFIKAYIAKHQQDPEWKKYIALLMYLNSASETNQLLEVRYLDKLESLAINHNFMLKDILSKYLLGELALVDSRSSLSIIDPYTLKPYTKLTFSSYKKTNFTNSIRSTVNYDILKRYNKT